MNLARLRRLACALAGALIVVVLDAAASSKPVTFVFAAPADPDVANPFARELWAEVVTPSGRVLRLPAYYSGGQTFTVHARPDEKGTYRLGRITDRTGGKAGALLAAELQTPPTVANPAVTLPPAVRRDPANPGRFVRTNGTPFIPAGANLAWAHGEPVEYYRRALASFAAADLNWMRVWMAHWSGLNLDWMADDMGPSPAPGLLDSRVADTWDRLLEAAGERGVYLQVVLQHHGQYSTTTNPNWATNPWNAANPGGFLPNPGSFFTSPEARRLTAQKYRYIVARWGWSPAIFAWELFNEVHWVDAIHEDQNEAAVAEWHATMAGVLRAADAYQHLVTTSTEDLRSPVYDRMDFYQPHLYAANLVAGARSQGPVAVTDRPVFYGEVGDDHLRVTDAIKQSGATVLPPVWASLMGRGILPAQPWEGWRLVDQDRLDELGAVPRFLEGSGLARERGLAPFSAVVESATRVPLQIPAGQVWQRRAGPDFTLPLDGREPLELADVPGYFASNVRPRDDGFPGQATFHLNVPRDTTLTAHVTEIGQKGAMLRFTLDGHVAAEGRWTAATVPAELTAPLPAGKHTLVVDNPGGLDWVGVSAIDLGLDVAVLGAIGQRSDNFITLWVWHRTNLYAPEPLTPAEGVLQVDDVPAGSWRIAWWDTKKGTAAPPVVVAHAGGRLSVPVPALRRHAAVVLTRVPAAR